MQIVSTQALDGLLVACFALRTPSAAVLVASTSHSALPLKALGPVVSRLNRWQQDMPTIMASAEPEISELELILEQPNMAEAYRTFALHLGPEVPIPRCAPCSRPWPSIACCIALMPVAN